MCEFTSLTIANYLSKYTSIINCSYFLGELGDIPGRKMNQLIFELCFDK